jgi:hypothetical protein
MDSHTAFQRDLLDFTLSIPTDSMEKNITPEKRASRSSTEGNSVFNCSQLHSRGFCLLIPQKYQAAQNKSETNDKH